MATIVIRRGEKSYLCWQYLFNNHIPFQSYRLYSTELDDYSQDELLAFSVADESVASYCALRFS